MGITIDKAVTFFLLWVLPFLLTMVGYFKMNQEDKKDVRTTFISAKWIFSLGFFLLGIYLGAIGRFLTIFVLEQIAIPFVLVGGIILSIQLWQKTKLKGMIVMVITFGLIIFTLI
ncbi:hypothetical protein ACO11K_002172 [Bacillus cytotoxicus]